MNYEPDPETLRKKIAQACWRVAKETARMHLTSGKLRMYEDTFE